MKNTQDSQNKKENTQNETQENEKRKQLHLPADKREDLIKEIVRLSNQEKLTLKKIAEELNLGTADSVSKRLKRAGYKKIDGQYKCLSETDNQNKENNSSEKTNENGMKDIVKMIQDINKRLDKIENKEQGGMLVTDEVMDYRPFSARVDKVILSKFNELAEGKLVNVNKSYLLSIALKEFVDKWS